MSTRAIVIFPKGDHAVEIDRLRAKFDPLALAIAPHITLVFPFESDITTADLVAHVENALSGMSSFPIRLARVVGHANEYLYLNIERGGAGLIELHTRLYSGSMAPHRSLEHTYAPHLTIGRLQTRAAFVEALAHATTIETVVATEAHEVAVVQLDETGRWRTEAKVPLRPR
ncbi:MAG TPA: 2'-5' RNA ligase family protein [Gemmatimonadaceae bacterium]|nr:2'-5' RNA ligase family protein [Gemmatimonadaceae bacterium]